MRSCDLSHAAFRLWCVLSSHKNGSGIAWPSWETLVFETRTSKKTLRGALRDLVRSGWLVILESGRGRASNRYQVIYPCLVGGKEHPQASRSRGKATPTTDCSGGKPAPTTAPARNRSGGQTTPRDGGKRTPLAAVVGVKLPPKGIREEIEGKKRESVHAREILSARKKFIPPSLEEVQRYCTSRRSRVDPEGFHEYFETGNWCDSKGNPVRNWKQKLLTWERYDPPSRDQPEPQTADDVMNQYRIVDRTEIAATP